MECFFTEIMVLYTQMPMAISLQMFVIHVPLLFFEIRHLDCPWQTTCGLEMSLSNCKSLPFLNASSSLAIFQLYTLSNCIPKKKLPVNGPLPTCIVVCGGMCQPIALIQMIL